MSQTDNIMDTPLIRRLSQTERRFAELQDSLGDPVSLHFRFVGVLECVGSQRRRMMAQRQSILTLAAQYRDMRDQQCLIQHLDGRNSITAARLAACKGWPTRW